MEREDTVVLENLLKKLPHKMVPVTIFLELVYAYLARVVPRHKWVDRGQVAECWVDAVGSSGTSQTLGRCPSPRANIIYNIHLF